ncbi:uncharacterized protein LOC117408969 isoform X2 [Acipenser ruthenus]|uniref:uncharacterized protein LOC117408969 isoform X2 n=1 Tax=Acipenser ruthenus TaxID=7906 RepID=UPI00274207A8|nr:uncharacterized protein LOC117408969 isoform X2 [Acipenser ruthenus]
MQSSVSSRLIVLGLMLAIVTDVQAEVKTTSNLNSTVASTSPVTDTSNDLSAPSTVSTIGDTETTATISNKKNETSTQYPKKTNPVGNVSISTTVSTINTGTRTAAASTTPLLPISSTTRAEISVTTSTQVFLVSTTTYELSQDKAGFIILGVFIIAIILTVIIIVFLRKKTRRYSFDLYRKHHEDTEIPISIMDGEGAIEAIAKNSGFDNEKEEKVVNETKASPKTSTSGNGQEKPETVSNPGVNGEEGRAPCSGELPESTQDSCFTEIQLAQAP